MEWRGIRKSDSKDPLHLSLFIGQWELLNQIPNFTDMNLTLCTLNSIINLPVRHPHHHFPIQIIKALNILIVI